MEMIVDKKSSVSEQTCQQVLRDIAHERIESEYMTYRIVSLRSGYSINYTRVVMRELVKRGWIVVAPGNRPNWKKVRLTEQGKNML